MKEPVKIQIGETDYQIDLDDVTSIQSMPWSERKKLIGLLETIQQADHIKAEEPKKTIIPDEPTANQTNSPELDPEIKKSDADIDAVMNRLLLESGPQRQIPDKKQAYLWLIGIVVVFLVLAVTLS